MTCVQCRDINSTELMSTHCTHVIHISQQVNVQCVDINSLTTQVFLVQSHFVRNWQRNVTHRAPAKHFMESCRNDAISLLHQNFSHKWHNVPTLLTEEICAINYVLHKRQIIRLHPCIVLGRSLISKSQNFASGQLASSWGTFPLAHGNLLGVLSFQLFRFSAGTTTYA